VYFREIEVLGEAPAANVRGRVFVSNHVNAIIDPILVITTAPCDVSPVAKSTLWKVPVLKWLLDVVEAVQIVRRRDDPSKQGGSDDVVFDRVAKWLQGGGNLLIFPEGSSHNEPHLIELKTGAARMLLRACEAGPPDPVTFQSVALEFDAREKFRSRVLLIYGPVRSTAAFPQRGAEFIAAVTAKIKDDLSELLVEGATWDERLLIARVAEMLAHDAGDPTLAGWNAIGRQVEAARKMLAADTTTVDTVRAAVDAYHERLAALGLTDAELAASLAPRTMGIFRKLYLSLTLPFAATGILAYSPPYWLTNLIAARVTSPDETSTIKLGAGLVLYPLWAALLIAISLWLAPRPHDFVLAALALLSPFAAVTWLDASPELRRSLRAMWQGRARLEETRALRKEAMIRIGEAQSRLGL